MIICVGNDDVKKKEGRYYEKLRDYYDIGYKRKKE